MKIIDSIMTRNPCYRAGQKIAVKGLMLHSVGCPQPNAQAFIRNWDNESFGSACVHGFIDGNSGDIYQTLPWDHRGWHCGGAGNNTHIGVEMCEPGCIAYRTGSTFVVYDRAAAITVTRRTYNSAVELFAMLCTKFGLDPRRDIVSHREGYLQGIATNHGDPEHLWRGLGLEYTMNGFRSDVAAKMGANLGKMGDKVGTQAKDLSGYGNKKKIRKISKLFTEEMKRSGVPASVSCAQCILESGYLTSELATNANNLFGMKANLSGNSWGSVWDGKLYGVDTTEYGSDGFVSVRAEFRKYPDIETSIKDHAQYLANAMHGNQKRYAGLIGCMDFKRAATIIYNGGYATDPGYVSKIVRLVEKYKLDKLDVVYEPVFVPYTVKVDRDDLRIRTGPGTGFVWTGKYTGKGIFTIIEENQGKGSASGWGKLKSGLGWISLDYTVRN